jgi:hypothetical protein
MLEPLLIVSGWEKFFQPNITLHASLFFVFASWFLDVLINVGVIMENTRKKYFW